MFPPVALLMGGVGPLRRPLSNRSPGMKIVKLKQEGPAWHRWRARGVGGSGSVAVLGAAEGASADDLLEVKLGLREVAENARMARGKRLEPGARARYCAE